MAFLNKTYENFPEDDDSDVVSDTTGENTIDTMIESLDKEIDDLSHREDDECAGPQIEMKEMNQNKKKNQWDVFKETSKENQTLEEGSDVWHIVLVVTKIIFSFILFCFILGAGLISKTTLFVVVSNILPPGASQNSSLKSHNHRLRFATTETGITWIWSLVLITVAPYVFTLFMSLWRMAFKRTRPLEKQPLLVGLVFETIHSVGMNLFTFAILPNLDPVAGLLISTNVAILPSLFRLIYSGHSIEGHTEASSQKVKRLLSSGMALLLGLLSLCFWTYFCHKMDAERFKDHPGLVVLLIVCPLMVSVYWWENFVSLKLKHHLRSRRTKINALVSAWKIILTIAMVTALYSVECGENMTCLKTLYNISTNATLSSSIFGKTSLVSNTSIGSCTTYLPLIIAAINVAASGLCYRCCAAACKILAQIPSFSLPLTLLTPCTLIIMLGILLQKDFKLSEGCFLPFPQWHGDLDLDWSLMLAAILSYIALIAATNYVWRPGKKRMQREARLFVQPFYCGVLFDQSMLLNRRQYEHAHIRGVDEKEKFEELPIPDNLDSWQPNEGDWSPLRQPDTPFIYLCATMWHETENEMTQILKSLFRMDEDQCARRNLQLFFGIRDPDYYEFEAHIFFDDAFNQDAEGTTQLNRYVQQLIVALDVAVSSVMGSDIKIHPPTKINTPYGGRLIWKLPGGNKLIVHLKDKTKIRHRKRWSQVMYMYFFLGHKLLSMGGGKERIRTVANNTFILALDGDVDFQPTAVKLLVDRMKRNPNVGAACGRIHPIGSGPMVWYQKFEYAVGHWLQKATEHVIGCVLCSPGCFSMYRGSSIMDDNIMRRFTSPPTKAKHHIQYDQGEDRWLCTLLLHQGYRVEYCAASDALTYAPEGFYEFYKQRRRWNPSTLANILDLLMNWKQVTKKNSDISFPFMCYQMFVMILTVLAPGIVFLLFLDAFLKEYPNVSLYWALTINLAPVVLFILLCFWAKDDIQLAFAAVFSMGYALAMVMLLIGLIKKATDNGLCSLSTGFLCFIAGLFILSAVIHPKEFWCMIHGILYCLIVPSMTILLMIYSLCNIHIVSWGTREAPKPHTTDRSANQQQPAEAKNGVADWLTRFGVLEALGKSDYVFSFGKLFKCLCCPTKVNDPQDLKLRVILDRLERMEARILNQTGSDAGSEVSHGIEESNEFVAFSETAGLFEGATDRENPLFNDDIDDDKNETSWTQVEILRDGVIESLKPEEDVFWRELIDTYLFPLEGNKNREEKAQTELVELRNRVCLFFFVLNALFVFVVVSLQKIDADGDESLSFKLGCAKDDYGETIKPISFVLLPIFGLLLLIQLICMIIHRMSTFLHIMSSTEIKGVLQQRKSERRDQFNVENGLKLVREMQDNAHIPSDKASEATPTKDQGWIDKNGFGTLSHNFVKNFKKLQKQLQQKETLSRMTFHQSVKESVYQGDAVSMRNRDRENGDLHSLDTVYPEIKRSSIVAIAKLARDPSFKNEIIKRRRTITS